MGERAKGRSFESLKKNYDTFQDDAKQEAAKADVVRATEKAVASLNEAYNHASSLVDLMVRIAYFPYKKSRFLCLKNRPIIPQLHYFINLYESKPR